MSDENLPRHRILGPGDEVFDVPAVLPLIPVRDVVVFPGVTVPLAIGRRKSLAALAHAGRVRGARGGMPKARVLAVDDQRYFRELIEGLLTDEGYEVQTASSGEEALHILEREDFQIVGIGEKSCVLGTSDK